MAPIWLCHRRITCAGVRPCAAATAATSGLSSTSVSGPSGLYDSVTMPRWSCHARSSDWLNSGCSSTWFTAGQTPVRSTISSTWAGVKFETPIDARLPLRAQVDQRLPRLDVLADRRQRPVDEVQVDVVEAKAGQALVEPGEGLAASVLRTRELGGHEELLARQPRRGDRPPHAGLVAVRCRGVDEPVSGPECVADGRERLIVVHGPRAQAELGNRVTVRHGPRWRKRGFEHRSLLRAYRSRAQPSRERYST